MGIIHTPRVIASVAKGLWKQIGSDQKLLGITKPQKYTGRVGLFDVDYLGHMNNAVYFNHAEYARWEMTAVNGMLNAMLRTNSHFVLTSTTCRYRAEVRPLFRKFEVQSNVGGMDDKSFWIYHTFRNVSETDNRLRAQIVAKGSIVRNGRVVKPRNFLEEDIGVTSDVLDGLSRPNDDPTIEDLISHSENVDSSFRVLSSKDDEKILSKS